jgi:hypothetical protein
VTRAVLVAGLLAASLAFGILTAIVQSHNRAEGARLDGLREDCLLLEAVHGAQRAAILEKDHGPLPPVEVTDANAKTTKSAKPGAGARPQGAP